jgi:perosamine synthetase
MMTTGGQGGMVVARDRALVDAVRDYREFDCRRDRMPRFNLQMTDLQAAVGRVQLRRLPEFIARREHLFAIYRKAGLRLLDVPPATPECTPVRYRAVIRTANPAKVVQALADHGIRAIVPLEDWELLGDPAAFPHAWEMTRTSVSLPVFPALRDAQVETIARILREIE